MERAVILLKGTDLAINEIALMLGYSNSSNFTGHSGSITVFLRGNISINACPMWMIFPPESFLRLTVRGIRQRHNIQAEGP